MPMTSPSAHTTIGVAGCGAMGLPMARRLRDAGYDVWGFDVRKPAEFGDFAERMVADPADFAARCGIVISVVRDARQTLDLCFDRQAIFGGSRRPGLLVLSSTLSPRFMLDIAERLPEGTGLVDAPMSGAPHGAKDGSLTFMVGGGAARFEALLPVFRAMGRSVHHLGPIGTGMTFKVCNNFVAAASVVAVRRAYAAARALGTDVERLREVMATSSGGTWYGNNYDRISWAREGYDADNTMGILEKDVTAFLDAVAALPDDGATPFDRAVVDGLRHLIPDMDSEG